MPINSVSHYANCSGLSSCDSIVENKFFLPGSNAEVGGQELLNRMGPEFAKQVNQELKGCYDLHGGQLVPAAFLGNDPVDVAARERMTKFLAPIVQGFMEQPRSPEHTARVVSALAGEFPKGLVDQYIASLPMVKKGQITKREQCLPPGGSIQPPPAQSPEAVYGRSEMPRTVASADKRTGLYKIGDWSCAPTMNKRTGTITSPVCEVSEAQLKQLYTLRLPHGGDGASPPVDRQAAWVQRNICSVAPHVAPVRCGLKEAPVVITTHFKNVGVQGKELYLKSLYEQADALSPSALDAIRQKPRYPELHEQISTAVQGRLRQAEEPRLLNPDDVTRAIYVVLKSRQEGGPYRETPDEAVVRLAERVSEGGWAFPETVEKHISREIDHRFP